MKEDEEDEEVWWWWKRRIHLCEEVLSFIIVATNSAEKGAVAAEGLQVVRLERERHLVVVFSIVILFAHTL